MNSELLQTCEELVKLMTKGIALKVKRTRAGASNKSLKAFGTNGTKKAKAICTKQRRRQKQVAITTPSISNSPPTKFTLLELNREPSRGRIQRKKRGKRSLVKIIKLLLQMRNDLLSIGNTSRSKSKRKFMKFVKLRGGDKTVHSTRRPRGPILNTGRSINTKMNKMRTGKKKMRNITNITSAVRTFCI